MPSWFIIVFHFLLFWYGGQFLLGESGGNDIILIIGRGNMIPCILAPYILILC